MIPFFMIGNKAGIFALTSPSRHLIGCPIRVLIRQKEKETDQKERKLSPFSENKIVYMENSKRILKKKKHKKQLALKNRLIKTAKKQRQYENINIILYSSNELLETEMRIIIYNDTKCLIPQVKNLTKCMQSLCIRL